MSFLWVQPCWVEVMRADKGAFFTVDYCVFNTPWKKRTRIYTDTSLRGLKLECRGGHSHVHLKGYSAKHRRAWTKVAEPYPRGLNKLLAYSLAEKYLPAAEKLVLDFGGMRLGHRRVGEAKNPGPTATAQLFSLEEVALVSRSTQKLQRQVLDEFDLWMENVWGLVFSTGISTL